MSGVDKMVRRTVRWFGGHGFMTQGEKKQKDKAQWQDKQNKIFQGVPMPDPEELKREQRKKAAGRKGSRASTVLTNRDTLG
jgi:hypothetical protein